MMKKVKESSLMHKFAEIQQQQTALIEKICIILQSQVHPNFTLLSQICEIVIVAIETVEMIKDIHGEQKKELVFLCVTHLLKDQFDEKQINTLIKPIILNAIDSFIKISKDGLEVNVRKRCCSLFKKKSKN